ncbi:MAG: cation-translocating P-type ATPase [Patescibacteria group bacterium UBA2163]
MKNNTAKKDFLSEKKDSWHTLSKEVVLEQLATSESSGLSFDEVEKRHKECGYNTLEEKQSSSPIKTFLLQFKSPLVVILILAGLGALYLGEKVDAIVIMLALLVNVIIGFVQEYRAQRSFLALLTSEEHEVTVLRDGERAVVSARNLVPGDIFFVEAGGIIPADAYLISERDLSVSEAHLTGESSSVHKTSGTLSHEAMIYERTNILFSGSPVLTGSAQGVVIKTGEDAEIGTIAESLNNYKAAETPIEKSVSRLAHFLSIMVVIVITGLIVLGFLRGMPFSEIIILAIALAVSLVPEGLPAAVTVILAVGMEEILKKKGLVRNLLAAETLGSTTIIITDKTGTLTQASMSVAGLITHEDKGVYIPGELSSTQERLLTAAMYVSESYYINDTNEVYGGDPLERAILTAARKNGLTEKMLTPGQQKIDTLKFNSDRQFAAALYADEDEVAHLYISGAPEVVLEGASRIQGSEGPEALSNERREALREELQVLATAGKRIVGVAYTPYKGEVIDRDNEKALLQDTVFIGFIAFADPIRAEVPAAITEVHGAGVRVVMVTGDKPETALNVAQQVGIADVGSRYVMGSDIDTMTDEELYTALRTIPVFARVLPKQKQRLVRVLQAHDEVVAMTGDGVNDAPALQSAQIGIAVGSGTEVAREASDLILLDDSFSIIVAAIREGRRILDNIKKAITHLISTSFHEVFLISAALITGLPLPLLPVQILWVNIFEEGLLTFGYAFEPHEKNAMQRSPHEVRAQTALTPAVKKLIIIAGTISGLFSIALFVWLLNRGIPIEEVRTIMFVVLSLDAIFFGISLKNLHRPIWEINPFTNHYLLFALAVATLGIVASLVVEPLRSLLSLTMPNPFDIIVLIGVAIANIITIEFAKVVAFRKNGKITA